MSEGHNPRLWKAALGIFLAVLFMSVSYYFTKPQIFTIVFGAGIVSAIIGAFEAGMANYDFLTRRKMEMMNAQRLVFEAYKGATPEEKGAFARLFPEINIEIAENGQPVFYWQGTRVPVFVFQEFLKESDDRSTVAQRNWKARGRETYDDGTVIDYHWCWLAIYKKLVEMDYVIEASHNGPRSEQWRGNAYKHLWNDWMGVPFGIPELTD